MFLLILALLTTACFEETVVERLTLRFLPDGRAEATATIEIDPGALEDEEDGRLGRWATEVLEGRDAWARRFGELDAAQETFRWEKRDGLLHRAERAAILEDPSGLSALFGDTAVAVEYDEEGGRSELAFYPGPSSRATREERQRVDRAFDEWSKAISQYLAGVEDFYRELDARPGRARALVSALFDDVLDAEAPDLTGAEQELVDELSQRMEGVIGVLASEGDGDSLEELSRLAYDPFPVPLRIEIPGEPLEVEGLWQRPEGDGTVLVVPGLSFWKALTSLEGRWVFPDPVLTWVWMARTEPEGAQARAALDEILSPATRRIEPAPLPAEVRQTLEDRLAAEPAYRVTWNLNPPPATPPAPP